MSKSVHDDVLDAALDYIKDNVGRMCVCSQEPTTYTEAITTYKLADIDISSADITGPINGDASGRKITINQQTDVDIDTTGYGTHIALVDITNEKLLYVTACPINELNAGNNHDIEAWDIEFSDPV